MSSNEYITVNALSSQLSQLVVGQTGHVGLTMLPNGAIVTVFQPEPTPTAPQPSGIQMDMRCEDCKEDYCRECLDECLGIHDTHCHSFEGPDHTHGHCRLLLPLPERMHKIARERLDEDLDEMYKERMEWQSRRNRNHT